MSNLSHEKILLNEHIDDIFEQKIEVGAVIQFDLLQRLIEEFIKRQKSLNDKVNNLELIINSSSGPFNNSVIEENKLDESKTSLDYKTSKEIIIKEKENKDENNNLSIDNIVKTEKEENQVKKEKIKSEEDDNRVEQHNKKELIHNQYRILSSRFEKFEKNLIELKKKVNNLNETEPHKEQNGISDKLIKKQDEKIEKLENDINYINQKIKEMSIFQIEYSNDNKDESEEDKNKNAQIMKMLIKKIDLMENKSKKNDEDIFKLKKDLTGINNLLSSDKNTNNDYNEFSNEINKNYNKFIDGVNKDINSLKNLMSEKEEIIRNDLTNKFEKENSDLKKMVEELKNNTNTYLENNIIDNILNSSKFNEKLNNLKNDLKDLMKQNITEIEENRKSLINSLGIENIKKQISSIQESLSEKLIKADLDYIDLKFKDIEKSLTSKTLRLDELEKDLIECNSTCTKTKKMMEYLSGHVTQNGKPEKKSEKKGDKNIFTLEEKDLQFLVNKDEFSQEIKKLYEKIEQILLVESENYKFVQYVESRLKYFVTQKDFKLLEKSLTNMIDELNINFARKYMEKSEILKNIKLLEIQLKNLQDSNPGMIKEGDNWLLAKKPMNNYLCASCEAYIGELKNKKTYLPWNKIPPHDISTKYRMGNGFSRMLELVNTDIIKNAEKIDNNLIIKEGKKINYDNMYRLPRVGSQINLKKINKKMTTFYANNANIEKKLNNSMDGLDTSLKNNKKGRNKTLRQNSEGIFMSDFSAITSSYDKDFNYPQLLKIIKKTKKDI